MIKDTFKQLNKKGEAGLITYITGGDPSPKYTANFIQLLAENGADIIEVGIPFSDPIADGPIIQAADVRALSAGTTPNMIFDIVKQVKNEIDVPIVLLSYFNILFKMKIKRFVEQASAHGIDGLIIPDLPIEEAEEYVDEAEKVNLDTIFLATPGTSLERLDKILRYTSGFLYLVSVYGITGIRKGISEITKRTIKKFKPHTKNVVPLAVGFGISKPEHVYSVISQGADAAIIGSAFVKIIEDNLGNNNNLIEQLSTFISKMKSATL
jgi:tryptophan synthase alpha chain